MSVRAFTRDAFLAEARRQNYPVGPNGVPAINNALADAHAAEGARPQRTKARCSL